MGRGRSSSGGGSSRGSSSFGSSRGSSGFGGRSFHGGHRHTTVIVGGHGHYNSSGGSIFGIIIGAIFCLVGLFIVLGGFGKLFGSMKYSTVQAECVNNEKAGGWYYTTYDYTVNGKDYTNRSMEGWEFPEDVGKVVTIYYLKSDPNVIYEENPVDKSEAGIIIFVGLMCAGMGTLPLVICIKSLKRGKSGGDEKLDSSLETASQSVRCPYCGAKYNKNSHTCPKCGASRID